jgi:hypothetical protein
MGFRFQSRIKILPDLRLNLSKSGIGISAGIPGLRVGVDSRGRGYTSAGIPGTGLSVRNYAKKAILKPPRIRTPRSAWTLEDLIAA